MIRPFSLSDLEFILQIENQSFPKSPYDWMTFLNLHTLYPETFLVYVGANSGQEAKKILAYIVFSQDGHILSIAVHPHHRGKGIGRELLQGAVKACPFKKVWAEVRRSNQGARAFYSKLGFQTIGMVRNYYGNEDALIMESPSLDSPPPPLGKVERE